MCKTNLTSIAFLLVITLSSCAQHKSLVQKPTFTIKDGAVSAWVSDDSNKSSGMDVSFSVNDLPRDVTLDSLYFKGQYAAVIPGKKEDQYIARFNSKEKKDFILSSDMSKEANNPKPHIPKKPPVALKLNEALLFYTKDGQKLYHKITSLRDKGTKFPGEAPMN